VRQSSKRGDSRTLPRLSAPRVLGSARGSKFTGTRFRAAELWRLVVERLSVRARPGVTAHKPTLFYVRWLCKTGRSIR
jgi:hypothetical protein